MQFCKLINISVYTTFRANAFQWREKQKITLISIEKLKIHLFSVLLFCFVWFWCVFKAQFEIKFSHFSLHHTLSHTQNSTFDDVYFTCRLKLFVKSTEKMLIKTWRKHQNLITIFTCRIFILISPFHYFTLKSSMISYMFFPVANGRKQQRHFVQLHYCLLNSLFCCNFFGLITLVYRVVVLVYSPRALQSIYGMMHESYKTLLQLLKKIIINLICFDYNFWFFSSLPSKNSLKRLWISCSKNLSKKKIVFAFNLVRIKRQWLHFECQRLDFPLVTMAQTIHRFHLNSHLEFPRSISRQTMDRFHTLSPSNSIYDLLAICPTTHETIWPEKYQQKTKECH